MKQNYQISNQNILEHVDKISANAAEAGHFSTLSALLAALIFASLMILITNPPKERMKKSFSTPIFGLLLVFFLLLLSTFLYIPVTGSTFLPEQEISFMIANIVFSLGFVEVFVAISWFFLLYDIGPTILPMTRSLFHGVVFLVVINIVSGVYNVFKNISSYYDSINVPTYGEVVLMFASISILPIIGTSLWYTIFSHKRQKLRNVTIKIAMIMSIIFAIILNIYYVYLFSFWDHNNCPLINWSKYVFLFVLGVFLFFFEISFPPKLYEENDS